LSESAGFWGRYDKNILVFSVHSIVREIVGQLHEHFCSSAFIFVYAHTSLFQSTSQYR